MGHRLAVLAVALTVALGLAGCAQEKIHSPEDTRGAADADVAADVADTMAEDTVRADVLADVGSDALAEDVAHDDTGPNAEDAEGADGVDTADAATDVDEDGAATDVDDDGAAGDTDAADADAASDDATDDAAGDTTGGDAGDTSTGDDAAEDTTLADTTLADTASDAAEDVAIDTALADTAADAGGDACATTETTSPILESPHITTCSLTPYTDSLPTSGPHYPIWAAFKVYDGPVPQGFLVHALEHGAIVITYRCDAGCDDDLAALVAFLDTLPTDPACTPPVKNRVIVAPDPTLPVRFAARAWGVALTADCFALDALAGFIDAHYGMGPEALCAQGTDILAPDSGIPADCGQP